MQLAAGVSVPVAGQDDAREAGLAAHDGVDEEDEGRRQAEEELELLLKKEWDEANASGKNRLLEFWKHHMWPLALFVPGLILLFGPHVYEAVMNIDTVTESADVQESIMWAEFFGILLSSLFPAQLFYMILVVISDLMLAQVAKAKVARALTPGEAVGKRRKECCRPAGWFCCTVLQSERQVSKRLRDLSNLNYLLWGTREHAPYVLWLASASIWVRFFTQVQARGPADVSGLEIALKVIVSILLFASALLLACVADLIISQGFGMRGKFRRITTSMHSEKVLQTLFGIENPVFDTIYSDLTSSLLDNLQDFTLRSAVTYIESHRVDGSFRGASLHQLEEETRALALLDRSESVVFDRSVSVGLDLFDRLQALIATSESGASNPTRDDDHAAAGKPRKASFFNLFSGTDRQLNKKRILEERRSSRSEGWRTLQVSQLTQAIEKSGFLGGREGLSFVHGGTESPWKSLLYDAPP